MFEHEILYTKFLPSTPLTLSWQRGPSHIKNSLYMTDIYMIGTSYKSLF